MALLGAILLLLPAAFLALVVLKYGLAVGYPFEALDAAVYAHPVGAKLFNNVTPVLFVGGPLLTIVLNAFVALDVSLRRERADLLGTISVRTKPWNLAVLVTACAFVVTFLLYVLAENWQCLVGAETAC